MQQQGLTALRKTLKVGRQHLPILLAGGGYGHGRFREVAREVRHKVPLCNLYVDIAQKMGVETESFGSSTGRFS